MASDTVSYVQPYEPVRRRLPGHGIVVVGVKILRHAWFPRPPLTVVHFCCATYLDSHQVLEDSPIFVGKRRQWTFWSFTMAAKKMWRNT